ncbi:hypothetical protein [Paenibacillus campi]|uniref:hypothetical protein n=1 Tax=Paenibacillus campi TaxID=3106031 RepID=UPI002AFE2C92|nr:MULTISPECIES: hypothetical protein [unclassified Paenibacillus]
MIKNRAFMIGIGIGIMIGAVLLQLVNIGKGETMLGGMQLTPEQIQQAAQAQNMQVYTADQKVYTREQWEALAKQEAEKKTQSQNSQQSQQQSTTTEPESTEPEQPESPEQPNVSNSSNAGTTSSTTNKAQASSGTVSSPAEPTTKATSTPQTPTTSTTKTAASKSFTVNRGELLKDVAYNLKKQGIIASQTEFIKRASQLKVNKILQVGSYRFSPGEDYDQILNALTEKSSP